MGQVMMDEIRARGWRPQAIGGMTMGADPIVTAVSILSSQKVQTRAPARTKDVDIAGYFIHGFLVRKAEKAHGMGQRVEGFQEQGASVVIVDDVCTTGSSTVQAIEAARQFGFRIIGVACLVEREEAGGRGAVQQAAAPSLFIPVFKSSEIKAAHLRLKNQ